MKQLTIIALATLLLSCTETKTTNGNAATATIHNLNKLDWLLESWYMDTPDGTISEEWHKVNDSLYKGFGMMKTLKGDTVFTEQIKLVANDDGLWYIPTVSNQNNGDEVRFKEKSDAGDEIVFENPAHDFPQRIIYHKLSDSTMRASIEGMQDGKMRNEEFSYKRK